MARRSGCGLRRRFFGSPSFSWHFPIARPGLHASLASAAVALLCISSAIHGAQTLTTGQSSKQDCEDTDHWLLQRQPCRRSPQERTAQRFGRQRLRLRRDAGAASVDSQQGSVQQRSLPRRVLSEAYSGGSRDLQIELPEELGIRISGDPLAPLRLHIHDQNTRFPPRDDESATPEPNGLNEGQFMCPAQPCPAMTPCQEHGHPALSSCWNADLEDQPERRRPPIVRQLHPWDMTLNALDLCLENVTGAFGDVVRPGCPWRGDWLGGREEGEDPVKWWREGWAGQVFELRNVYLDSYGRIFNKTHRFDAGGCLPRSEFSYGPSTRTTHFKEVINVISAPSDLADDSPAAGGSLQKATMLDSLIHELPLLLPVIRAMPAVKKAVLATRNRRLHRVVSRAIFGPKSFQSKLGASLAPKPGTLWKVSRLIQPVFQPCRQPSRALWRRLRSEHLLSKEAKAAAALVSLTPPLIPPSTPCIPRDWTIVLHHKLDASLAEHGRFRALVAQLFPDDRVHVTSAGKSLVEEKELFGRAALFITASVPSLSSIIFMPPNSTLLLLLPVSSPSSAATQASRSPPTNPRHTSSASLELALGLASACEIRTFLTFCTPLGAPLGATAEGRDSSSSSPLSNCSLPAVMEALDRVSHDAYTAHPPLPVTRPAFTPEVAASGAGAPLAQPGWFNLSEEGVAAYQSWAQCVSDSGEWVLNSTPRVLPWEYPGFMNLCDHRHFLSGGMVTAVADNAVAAGVGAAGWKVRESLKYEWRVKSDQCAVSELAPAPAGAGQGAPFAPFSGPDFCRLVGRGRTFLFLGDSLQDQMTAVFLNNMLRDIPKPAGWALNESIPQECIDWLPPNGMVPHIFCRDIRFSPSACPGMRLLFVRSDFLLLPNPRAFDRMEFTRFSFLKDVDVAVVNRGAHYEPTPKFERDLSAFLRYFRNRFPRMLVVYRNTPPGHKDCADITKPLTKRQDPGSLPFNWGEFVEQNAIAKRLVEGSGYVYLDVDTMTALRGDGHKGRREDNITDCLHYCTPGPLDVWPQHLYNTLLWVHPLSRYDQSGRSEG